MLSKRNRILILVSLILCLAGAAVFLGRGDADAAMSDPVSFSVPTGHYASLPQVRLRKSPDLPLHARIYYTLDGTAPDASSHLYTGGNLFADADLSEKEGPQLFAVRASVCLDGVFSAPAEATYLVGNLTADGELPYVSLLCDKDPLYDPADSVRTPVPGHLTVFAGDGTVLADQDVGLSTGDDMIVSSDTASIRIIAGYEYDPLFNKIPLSFPEWHSQASPTAQVYEHKQLLLSCGGRDDLRYHGTQIRSIAASRLAGKTDFTGSLHSMPCTVFYNGIFYDIADLGEVFSDSMLADRFHLADAADCEHFEGAETDVLADAGVLELFLEDLSLPESRALLEDQVDMDSYLQCCALNILLNRTDWPQMGFLAWRSLVQEERNPYSDGRLRFFVGKDSLIYHDSSLFSFFEGCGENALELLMSGNGYAGGSIFPHVMESPEYRSRLTAYLTSYSADAFAPQQVQAVILGARDEVHDAAVLRKGSRAAERLSANAEIIAAKAAADLSDTAAAAKRLLPAGELSAAASDNTPDSPLPEGLLIDEIYTKQEGDFFVLKNAGASQVLLSDYYVSDDVSALFRYRLPEVILLPGERLAIDGAKSAYAQGDYLCSFSLRTGETLYLTAADGTAADAFPIPRMTKHESVGRSSVDGTYLYYDNEDGRRRRIAYAAAKTASGDSTSGAVPTDSAAGIMAGYTAIADGETRMRADANRILSAEAPGSLSFSAAPGFYDDPFALEILRGRGMEGGTVYYTLDGSVPDKDSIPYTQPIRIEDASMHDNVHALREDVSVGFRTEEIAEYTWMDAPGYVIPDHPIDKCTIVRAVWIDPQGVSHEVISGSYFVGYQNRPAYSGLPVVSLLSDPASFFDYDTGIYVLGSVYDEYMADGDQEENKNYLFWEANYRMKGMRWERPVCVQIFDEAHAFLLSQDAGIRIQGNSSRGFVPRSFNLYARKRYNGTDYFDADLFGTGYLPKRFTLFAGGNDYVTVLHDHLLSTLLRGRNIATISYRPCAVFLDGEYWGVCQIAEKQDAQYLQ
ncbi:MAG: CotH kinase family protein, partial [Lachnospiraceae bacterium]|nr:CotH kinase family protein [Lachnospiraceae bacterium]